MLDNKRTCFSLRLAFLHTALLVQICLLCLCMCRDRQESLKKNRGFGIAKDYELLNRGWDFDLPDIRREFKGKKIHVWHGDVDTIVPYRLQKCVQRAIPEVVDLHSLHNHGHFSWFCCDPQAPVEILATLFEEEQHTKDEASKGTKEVIV